MITSQIYKVIKIISDTSILINCGADDNVKKDMEFEIYQPGIEVKDPDTGMVLGTLDYIKTTVNAVTVYDKMSICRKIEYVQSSLMDITQAAVSGIYGKHTAKTLDVDIEQISGGFENVDKTIRVGDLVRIARG